MKITNVWVLLSVKVGSKVWNDEKHTSEITWNAIYWFDQQHPLFFCWIFLAPPLLILVDESWVGLLGADVATLLLISRVINVKASSTFWAFFAEVSKNLTLKWSAKSFASLYGIYLWSSKSFLLPTKILEIFSCACLSTSLIHSETLAKESLSVISYVTMIPWAPL